LGVILDYDAAELLIAIEILDALSRVKGNDTARFRSRRRIQATWWRER
jgi:hypothetical protein